MDGLTNGQNEALEKFKIFQAMGGGGFYLLQGPAGSGKSYLQATLLGEMKKTNQRVALAASTYKAARVASDFMDGVAVSTAHAHLGLRESIGYNGELVFRPGPKYLEKASNYHTHFVDEASMVDDRVFDGFEDLYNDSKKVVFIGDNFQIPPVNHPSSLPFDVNTQRELAFTVATLTEVVRQAAGSPIIQLATDIRNNIYRPVLPLDYENKVNGLLAVRYASGGPSGRLSDDVLELFASDHFSANPDYVKIIAWRNKTVDTYNTQVRHRLFGENIPKLMVGEKLVADAPFREGQQTILKNNEDMEILGLTEDKDQLAEDAFLKIYKAHVKIYGAKGTFKEVIIPIIHEESEAEYNKYLTLLKAIAKKERKGSYKHKSAWMDYYKFMERYAHVKYSYAMTIHKSQGSTYDHAIVDLQDIMYNRKTEERNRILYTAVTRPKYTLKIIHGS